MELKLLILYIYIYIVWWRYVDDILAIWEHGEENLHKFISHINSFHPTIKFTYDFSKLSINFLDVEVHNKLVTDFFVKPTDTHQYLEASSCHVFHSKRAIPYSQEGLIIFTQSLPFLNRDVINLKNGYLIENTATN